MKRLIAVAALTLVPQPAVAEMAKQSLAVKVLCTSAGSLAGTMSTTGMPPPRNRRPRPSLGR